MTPRRLGAAKRRLERKRDAVALLPDLVAEVPTIEQDLADGETGGAREIASWRAQWAASWRRARRRIAALPEHTRLGLLRYWRTWTGPTSPEYLLTFVHQAETQQLNFWQRMREHRQLQLIGEGRFPQDRVKAIFAGKPGPGLLLVRGGGFFAKRRQAKRLRKSGVKVATGFGVQMYLQSPRTSCA